MLQMDLFDKTGKHKDDVKVNLGCWMGLTTHLTLSKLS